MEFNQKFSLQYFFYDIAQLLPSTDFKINCNEFLHYVKKFGWSGLVIRIKIDVTTDSAINISDINEP